MSKISLHGKEFDLTKHKYIWDGVRLIIKGEYRGNQENKNYIIPPKHYGKIFEIDVFIEPYGNNRIIIPYDRNE